MKIDLEKIKTLVEAGDTSALEVHILNEALEKSDIYGALENGDIKAAAEANKDVLSELDSLKDTHHQKALDKFKKNDVPKLIKDAQDEVRKELNPEETPEQKEIRELREAFEQEKQKNARAEVRSKLIEIAISEEVGLDPEYVAKHIDKYVPSNFEVVEGVIDTTTAIEAAKTDLTALSKDFESVVTKRIESTLKGAKRDDLGGGLGGQKTEVLLGEKLAKQNQHAQAKEQQKQFF